MSLPPSEMNLGRLASSYVVLNRAKNSCKRKTRQLVLFLPVKTAPLPILFPERLLFSTVATTPLSQSVDEILRPPVEPAGISAPGARNSKTREGTLMGVYASGRKSPLQEVGERVKVSAARFPAQAQNEHEIERLQRFPCLRAASEDRGWPAFAYLSKDVNESTGTGKTIV